MYRVFYQIEKHLKKKQPNPLYNNLMQRLKTRKQVYAIKHSSVSSGEHKKILESFLFRIGVEIDDFCDFFKKP